MLASVLHCLPRPNPRPRARCQGPLPESEAELPVKERALDRLAERIPRLVNSDRRGGRGVLTYNALSVTWRPAGTMTGLSEMPFGRS